MKHQPPPTTYDAKGRPMTKWDLLAEKEPPLDPKKFAPVGKAHEHGLSDDYAEQPFVKKFT